MTLASRLTAARKAAGLSQAELAAKLHVSAGTVGGWEAGNHRVRVDRLVRVAKVLRIDLAELLPLLPAKPKRGV